MINLLGVPYIDVRVSFNSFVPSNLDDNLAGRLVDYYLEKLIAQPSLRRQMNLIVYSCFTFDLLEKQSTKLWFFEVDQNRITESLLI